MKYESSTFATTSIRRTCGAVAALDVETAEFVCATPVLTGLPFGHVPTKVLLPVGARVDLVVQAREALMAWGHL